MSSLFITQKYFSMNMNVLLYISNFALPLRKTQKLTYTNMSKKNCEKNRIIFPIYESTRQNENMNFYQAAFVALLESPFVVENNIEGDFVVLNAIFHF